jgi:hypothetical protein
VAHGHIKNAEMGASGKKNRLLRGIFAQPNSDDSNSRALQVGQAQGFYAENLLRPLRSERDEQDLIVIVLDDFIESGPEFLKTEIIQRALENRILKPLAKGFTGFGHLPQSLRVANVVTDQIAGAGGHGQRVVNA